MKSTYCRKVAEFTLYSLLIYACYIFSGVYHQKILKHQYRNIYTQALSTFDGSIVFSFFPQLVSTILGWIILFLWKKQAGVEPVHIPAKKAIYCSLVINVSMLTYNKAVQVASFPAVVMIKSCSLLSVILISIFCSRVKDKSLRLGKSKLFIGIIVALGIFLFNHFKIQQPGRDQPISLIGGCFLLISLLGDGILPDLQAEIKSKYKPGVIDMYYSINKFTCLIAFIYCLATLQLPYIVNFILEHDQLQIDLLMLSFLNAIGQLVIYQMIKMFKQHIPPFVIATRKCVTVVVNLIYFGHSVNQMQIFGIALVFSAIMLEVYDNYLQKVKKQQQSVKTQANILEQSSGQLSLKSATKSSEEHSMQTLKLIPQKNNATLSKSQMINQLGTINPQQVAEQSISVAKNEVTHTRTQIESATISQ